MERTQASRILDQIHVPTLLLDERRARRNIARMAEKCRRSGTQLRPHFKTHQSAAVGEWFRAEGVTTITASSVRMAAYFADHDWHDITVAFPVNWREIDAINALAKRITLGLLVESLETADFLREKLTNPVDIWIEVDSGTPRTGVLWSDTDQIAALVDRLRNHPLIRLRGLLSHNGSSYGSHGKAQLKSAWKQSIERLIGARAALAERGITGLKLSPGDTPSCNVVDDFSGLDEIRPGNFVYNDLMQVINGSAAEADVAVAVACPVVSKHAERLQIVVYGGGVHLSKDNFVDQRGRTTYGAVAFPTADGWSESIPGAWVKSLSQEHGVIQCDAETFNRVDIGDLLIVIPVHSCMTADLLKQAVTLAGETVDMLVLTPHDI